MSDFEPGSIQRDKTMNSVEPEVEAYFSNNEREAIEVADLFASDHDETLGVYDFSCISRGLNPLTQEPWTDDEVTELMDKAGIDPREPTDWLESENEIAEIINDYLGNKEK